MTVAHEDQKLQGLASGRISSWSSGSPWGIELNSQNVQMEKETRNAVEGHRDAVDLGKDLGLKDLCNNKLT